MRAEWEERVENEVAELRAEGARVAAELEYKTARVLELEEARSKSEMERRALAESLDQLIREKEESEQVRLVAEAKLLSEERRAATCESEKLEEREKRERAEERVQALNDVINGLKSDKMNVENRLDQVVKMNSDIIKKASEISRYQSDLKNTTIGGCENFSVFMQDIEEKGEILVGLLKREQQAMDNGSMHMILP
jgi:chromosome segregation ATPase